MIAGVSWVWWVGFHAVVAAVLVATGFCPATARARHAQALVWLGTAALVLAAAGFAGWIAVAQGRQPALEFVAGYTIETSLSMDNLFVFMVLFQGFRISPQRQHKALLWGVCGAVVLRGAVYCGGRYADAALRLGDLDLRAVSALCGLEAGAGRVGARSHS